MKCAGSAICYLVRNVLARGRFARGNVLEVEGEIGSVVVMRKSIRREPPLPPHAPN